MSTSPYKNPAILSGTLRDAKHHGVAKQLPVTLPWHQQHHSGHVAQTRQYNFTNVPTDLLYGRTHQAVVRSRQLPALAHPVFKFRVSVVGSPTQLASVPNWINSCQVRDPSNNQAISTFFGATQLFTLLAQLNKGQLRSIAPNLNIDVSTDGYISAGKTLPVGEHVFYLPLPGSMLDLLKPYWAESAQDLIFDFNFNATPVVSGAGSVIVNELTLLTDASFMSDIVQAEKSRMSRAMVTETNFLEPSEIRTNVTLTPGQRSLIDLTAIQGKVAFISIDVRAANATNAGNGFMKLLNIGDDQGASIDLLNPTNQSVWGMGNSLETRFIRNEQSIHHFDSDFIAHKPHYLMSFTDSIPKSYKGVVDGFYPFTGEKMQLALYPGGAPVNEVQTLTSTAAPTSGFYRLSFKGAFSTPLAHTATTADMSAAFALISTASRSNITCAFSGTLASGIDVIATFSTPETPGCEGDLLIVLSNGLANAGNTVSNTTALTTAGRAGVTAGNYEVRVTAWRFYRGSYFNGSLRSYML